MSADNSYFLLAAHQLRSPLVAMRTLLATLLNTGVSDEEQAMKLIRHLDDRCGDMINLVNDLLNLGEANKPEEVPDGGADALDVLEDVLQNLEPVAKKKSLKIEFEKKDCGAVRISPVALEQICVNVIENAVKYGKDGGVVVVKTGMEGDRFLLEVKDDGIGIPEGEIDNIFQEFHRADNARRLEKQGTGLGLAIVKKFVESAGGGISVKSVENEGTTFTIRLPSMWK